MPSSDIFIKPRHPVYINAGCSNIIEDFQVAVLKNRFEYKKQSHYGVSIVKRNLTHTFILKNYIFKYSTS